ncbi:MAG TPA: metallophosphoesterase [Vicinamibacteria bacterium]|nr:metallophosphoesterase [Vicinamibacteria bacterium]
MRLYAISDLHLGFRENREALETLGAHPEDWLILGGDVGETLAHLRMALDVVTRRFARVLWAPGNHELWSTKPGEERGQAKYDALVAVCRDRGVLTPEDPYVHWEGDGGSAVLAPLFLLYDYSFRPEEIAREEALQWAAESGVFCADERYLRSDPFPSIDAWCAARCEQAERKLHEASRRHPLVLINHFPLRKELVRLRRIPRFSIWCGTTRTEDWHVRFRARVVVSGHLHIRSTDWIDGVRFEEVSLGYPRHWNTNRGIEHYLREILPGPSPPG